MFALLTERLDPLAPVRLLVQWTLEEVHNLLTAVGFDPARAAGWVLAIMVLIFFVRVLLLPLAFRQARYQRRMQALAPQSHALRERHRNRPEPKSRRELAKEIAALYAEHRTNPLAMFAPLIVQLPILIALLQVLEAAAHGEPDALAPLATATLWGVPLSADILAGGAAAPLGLTILSITAAAQIVLQPISIDPHRATTGRRQMLHALPMALPIVSVTLCLTFPLAVTIYWMCSAIWALGQQALLLHPKHDDA